MSVNRLVCLLFLFGLITNCSDQKDQVKQGTTVPNAIINTQPEVEDVQPSEDGAEPADQGPYLIPGNEAYRRPNTGFMPRFGLNNERDDRTERNSKKPILFSVGEGAKTGVAGINFDMVLGEARDVLSEPTEYSCGYFYEEGICVDWKQDDPRKPVQMIVAGNYLGNFDMPDPVGRVRMGEKFAKYFDANDPTGSKVLEQVYNEYFKIKDSTYSCIQDGECEAREIDDALIWRMPNLFLQFSKDQSKQLYLIVLENKYDPGILASNFDITDANFVDEHKTKYALGDKWSKFLDQGETQDVESIVNVTTFLKKYDGVNVGIYRPDAFTSEVISSYQTPTQSSGDDLVASVSLFGGYSGHFKIGGKYVLVEDNAQVNLVSQVAADETSKVLKTKLSRFAGKFDLQVKLLKKLNLLVQDDLQAKYKNLQINSRMDGLQARPSAGRWLSVRTSFTGLSKDSGKFDAGVIFIGMSVSNAYLQVLRQKSLDPFYQQTYAKAQSTVDVRNRVQNSGNESHRQLAGFQLGQEVQLYNIDWQRLEASAKLGDKVIRVSFDPWASVKVSRFESETSGYRLWTANSLGGVLLGLEPVNGEGALGQSEITTKIRLISSSIIPEGVKGLCGLDTQIPLNSNYSKIRTSLLDELQKSDDAKKCMFFGRKNSVGDDEYSEVYFTQQNVKLLLSDKQFVGVVIYE